MEKDIHLILLVEDDPTHAGLIKRELYDSNKPIIIDHVTTGKQCLDQLDERDNYDLIIIDHKKY